MVKVPFPYTDRPITQYRPALVIAVSAQGVSPPLIWVLMITSATHRRWPGDVVLSELKTAGLPAASMVRSAKIAAVEDSAAETIGVLPVVDRSAVAGQVSASLSEVLASSPQTNAV